MSKIVWRTLWTAPKERIESLNLRLAFELVYMEVSEHRVAALHSNTCYNNQCMLCDSLIFDDLLIPINAVKGTVKENSDFSLV